MALEQLGRFVTCLENEQPGHRRGALINNMYHHIFTNNMTEFLGKQNLAKQLKTFELQGEGVFFWKAQLVSVTVVTEHIKQLKDVLDNLCFEIANCNTDKIKYEKMWTKFVLMTSYPQIFICYPESFSRSFMIDEMWNNSLVIEEYTGNEVENLEDIMFGHVLYPSNNKLKEPEIEESEDKEPNSTPIFGSPDRISEEMPSHIAYMGYSEKQFVEALQLNFGDIEMTYRYLTNNITPEFIPSDEESSFEFEGVFVEGDKEEWRKAKEIKDDRTLYELWSEYLENQSPQKLIELFNTDLSDQNYIFLNLLRSEIEYYLVAEKDEFGYIDTKKWEAFFVKYGDSLIALHKRICGISIDPIKQKNVVDEWNTFLNTNTACFKVLFEEFFRNMDNMYLMWLCGDWVVEQVLMDIEIQRINEPIVDLFCEYVCTPPHSILSNKTKTRNSNEALKEYQREMKEHGSTVFERKSNKTDDESSEYELDSYDESETSETEYSYEYDQLLPYKEIVKPENAHELKMMVQTGCINHWDEFGETLIMNAVRWRQDEAVIYLVKMGADLNIQNRAGKTVLHMTCGKLHKDRWSYIPFLLEHGANPEIRCNTGKTPMLYAIQNRSSSTMKALKDTCGFPWFYHRRLINQLPPFLQKILI